MENKTTELVIDLVADPFVPKGLEVVSHTRGDPFVWDPTKVELYVSENQKSGKVIRGHELLKELENTPVFNANMLDWIMKHPALVPKEWNNKVLVFWGTIYRVLSNGRLVVRCRCWADGTWIDSYGMLDNDWYVEHAAARRIR